MLHYFFIICTILFLGIRAKFHQPENADHKDQEFAPTREKLLAGQFSLILFLVHGWWIFNHPPPDFSIMIQYIGIFCMGGSLPLLYWVHHSLGKYFSARLELRINHEIIQTGPYKWVRHPMYSTGFLYLIGAGLVAGNVWVLVLPSISFGILVFLRIQDEEKMLEQIQNQEYQKYQQQSKKFIPFIW